MDIKLSDRLSKGLLLRYQMSMIELFCKNSQRPKAVFLGFLRSMPSILENYFTRP